MRSDCRFSQTLRRRVRISALAAMMLVMAAGMSSAMAQPPHEAAGATAAHEAAADEPHEQTLLQTVAKLVNFAILAGVLVHFLKSPIADYLAARSTQIRQDLLTAAEMRAAAAAQLAEIERKLQQLPAELSALKAQGAQDVIAEQARIAQAAEVERERLMAQTRREIEMRLRVARRELTEHAAMLAVRIAEERITRSITTDDQLRLVDRYTAQLRGAR
jgi:F-type H+-transporting ATPase subunit b